MSCSMMTLVMPRRLDLLQQLDGRVGVVPRHAGGRLVEQQEARLLDQAHGELQPALVAARQAAGMSRGGRSSSPTSSRSASASSRISVSLSSALARC